MAELDLRAKPWQSLREGLVLPTMVLGALPGVPYAWQSLREGLVLPTHECCTHAGRRFDGKACGRAWYFRHERLSKEIAFWTEWQSLREGLVLPTSDNSTSPRGPWRLWQSLREGFVLSTEHMDHLAGGRNQFTFSWE